MRLFFEIVRILRAKQPKCFILENVPALLTHDGGRTFAAVLEALAPYHVHHGILDSVDFGCPQYRSRLFIVGFREPTNFQFPVGGGDRRAIADILQDDVGPEYGFRHVDRLPDVIPETGKIPLRNPNGKIHQADWLIRSLEPSPTVIFQLFGITKSLKVIYPELRFLTPREVARIQGFPDSFLLDRNRLRAYSQLGNAVSPPVVRAIVEAIKKVLG